MNFSFLADKWPLLAEMGDLAEKNLYHDPNTSLIKLRMFGETIAKYLLAYENIKDPEDGKPISRLNILAAKGVIPDRLLPLFHSIRKNGNRATHEAFGSVEAATNHLQFAHRVACWFRQTYGEGTFTAQQYVFPQKELSDVEELRASNEDITIPLSPTRSQSFCTSGHPCRYPGSGSSRRDQECQAEGIQNFYQQDEAFRG